MKVPVSFYKCEVCGYVEEYSYPASEAPDTTICTVCYKNAVKQLGTFAGFNFKGHGWPSSKTAIA